MADIRRVKLPNGTTYNIKDNTARSNINNIINGNTKLPYGKSLSITNDTELNLLDPNNNVLSTVNLPKANAVTMIVPNDDTNSWTTEDGIEITELPLYTIVVLGVSYNQNNKYNLIVEDSDTVPFVSTSTRQFIGYISNIVDSSVTITKLYNNIQSYPSSVAGTGEWIPNSYEELNEFLRDRYDIRTIENIPVDDRYIKIENSGGTTIAYDNAKQYELTNGLVILFVKLSTSWYSSNLKFSGALKIANLNINVVACGNYYSAIGSARVVTNSDFSVSVTNLTDGSDEYDYLLLYCHRL